MVRIPDYTQGIVAQRETPRMYDPYAVAAKAAPTKAVAGVFDIGAKIATTMKNANDMTAVNGAVIKKKRSDIEFREQFFKDRSANPMGMAKDLEAAYKERDKAILESLPSQEARQSFQREADEINLHFYENDLSHETTLSAAMFTNKASQAIDDLAVMAYRGEPLEELNKQAEATAFTLTGIISETERQKFKDGARKNILMASLAGRLGHEPESVLNAVNNKEYDSILDVGEITKLKSQAESAIEDKKDRQEKLLLEQREESLVVQLENETTLMDNIINNDDVSYEEKVAQINDMDLNGKIRDDFAQEARAYVKSVQGVNAATNSQDMAEIVTQMYDLNTIAETSPKDYLMGIQNIRQDIMSRRGEGKLSKSDEIKLNNQLKTLTSSKVSDATNSVSYSFGEANKMIQTQLSPDMRGEAIRQLFYSTEGEEGQKKASKEGVSIKELYKSEALKIIDTLKLKKRQEVLQRVDEVINKPITDDEFIKSKGYAQQDIEETAAKYGITTQQVIQRLRAQ